MLPIGTAVELRPRSIRLRGETAAALTGGECERAAPSATTFAAVDGRRVAQARPLAVSPSGGGREAPARSNLAFRKKLPRCQPRRVIATRCKKRFRRRRRG